MNIFDQEHLVYFLLRMMNSVSTHVFFPLLLYVFIRLKFNFVIAPFSIPIKCFDVYQSVFQQKQTKLQFPFVAMNASFGFSTKRAISNDGQNVTTNLV